MADKKQRPIDLLLDRLAGQNPKLINGWYQCQCPAHDDKNPSLHFREHDDGGAQIKCWAGCTAQSIMASIGLETKHLLPDYSGTHYGKPYRGRNDKGWTEKETGVTWSHKCDYLYTDEDGNVLYYKSRYDADKGNRKKLFQYWRKCPQGKKINGLKSGWFDLKYGSWQLISESGPEADPPSIHAIYFEAPRQVLYKLHILVQDVRDRVPRVYLCEGEKDANALRGQGVASTTAPNGASDWKPEYTETLAMFRHVVIVADNDTAGLKSAIMKRDYLGAFDVPCSVVVCGSYKDPADLLANDGNIDDLVEIDPVAELAKFESKPESPASPSPPTISETTLHTLHEIKLPTTDIENTLEFVGFMGKEVRHCAGLGLYLEWRGTHYERDQTEGEPVFRRYRKFAAEVLNLAIAEIKESRESVWAASKKLNAEMLKEPADRSKRVIEETSEELKVAEKRVEKCNARLKNANRIQNIGAFKAVETLIRKTHPIPVTTNELDKENCLIPCLNGTVDLRTGKLLPSNPDHLFTRVIPVSYNPDADCPTFIQFLREATDEDFGLIKYLQGVAGYTLTGLSAENSFYFFYGPTRSGKSTFVNIMSHLLGGFARNLDKNHLMKQDKQGDIQEHFARLECARMVTALEVADRDRWDEAKIKLFTGSDPITARAPYERSREFVSTFKVWSTGNVRPAVREQGEAFWTRIKPIKFPNSLPVEKQDRDLDMKLKNELEGIFLWAIAGAVEWFKTKKLEIPESVLAEIEEYRKDVDVIGRFLREATREPRDNEDIKDTRALDLYNCFEKWGKETKTYTMQSKRFFEELKLRNDIKYSRSSAGWWLRNNLHRHQVSQSSRKTGVHGSGIQSSNDL